MRVVDADAEVPQLLIVEFRQLSPLKRLHQLLLEQLVEEQAPARLGLLVGALPDLVLDFRQKWRVELEVEVLGEALDEAEALEQRRAALEVHFEVGALQGVERLRDPIVLLDEVGLTLETNHAALEGLLVEVWAIVDETRSIAALRRHRSSLPADHVLRRGSWWSSCRTRRGPRRRSPGPSLCC